MEFQYEVKGPNQFVRTSICQKIDIAGEKKNVDIHIILYYYMSSVPRVTLSRLKPTAARKISIYYFHHM